MLKVWSFLTTMLYLLLPCAGTGVGRCGGVMGLWETGLVTPGGVLILPFEEGARPSLDIVKFESEWFRGVGAVEEEFKVELDLVVGAVPLDLLSSEALSW